MDEARDENQLVFSIEHPLSLFTTGQSLDVQHNTVVVLTKEKLPMPEFTELSDNDCACS